jgi:hypothetical protein
MTSGGGGAGAGTSGSTNYVGGAGAGSLRPVGPSRRGGGTGAPDPGPDLAGAPAHPDHPRQASWTRLYC